MEVDQYRPGHIIFTDYRSLKTTDGTSVRLIAGKTQVFGYKEGVRDRAVFNDIYGFTQIASNRVVVADRYNHCLRLIDRKTDSTSVLSGQCKSAGYHDGRPGRFFSPWSVVRDRKDTKLLLVTDHENRAVRAVNAQSGEVSTFVKSQEKLMYMRCLTQDSKGDVYITAWNAILKITYQSRKITHFAGAQSGAGGYIDSTLLGSMFFTPFDLTFIGPETLLVADTDNNKLRLLHMRTNKVTPVDLRSGNAEKIYSLLITHNSLFTGHKTGILRYQCEC